MDEILTLAEIESQYEAEWALLDQPQTNERREVQAGKVLYHSKDRDEVYWKAEELRPKRFAVFFTGSIPEGWEVVL
jgi:hypothetical protein